MKLQTYSNINLIFGITGSSLLLIGVFLPIIQFPIAGTINYFQNGRADGVIVLRLALTTFSIY